MNVVVVVVVVVVIHAVLAALGRQWIEVQHWSSQLLHL
jgi:hypothetical protein